MPRLLAAGVAGGCVVNLRGVLVYADGRTATVENLCGAEYIDADGNHFDSVGLAVAKYPEGHQYPEGSVTCVMVQRPPPRERRT